MNRKQRKCLWIGIAVFVLMGLFPPWYKSGETRTCYTYGFLLVPPGLQIYGSTMYRLDVHRLYVQWIMVAVVTGALVLTFNKKPTSDSGETGRKSETAPDSVGPQT